MNKDQLRGDIVEALVRNGYAGQAGDILEGHFAHEVAELISVEVVAPLLAEAEKKIAHLEMYEGVYRDVGEVLSKALGTGEGASLGEGIAGDVWLLGEKLRRAEASRRDWAADAVATDALAERLLTFHAQNEERLSFVARRYLADGSGVNFRGGRCTGVSSDALAWFAVGRRDEPKLGEYPADESDLAACERTYEMATEFLQERMLPVLERYRKHVSARSLPQCAVHPEGGE